MYSYYNSCFFKKDCSYRNNCGIRLHDGDLEHSLMKEKKRSSYVFLPIFMFCHSKFRFRDDNLYMFSWCFTNSNLLICSWHDMNLSQFVQCMCSFYNKSLLFTSISYEQESFKFNEVKHGWKCFSLFAIFLWPIILFGFRWHKDVLHFSVTKLLVRSVESDTSEKVLQ